VRPKHEIAEILHRYQNDFLARHKTSGQVLRTFSALKACRTSLLGGHQKKCKACAHQQIAYNSCRNRHCPKCQAVNRERWIAQRETELLAVPYFHIVFTLPYELNALSLQYLKEIYNALFQASWQTINTFASDYKHLGAKTGMSAILHTWGQNLSLHPHLNCIVPGGGISPKGKWITPTRSQKRSRREVKYLFPKRAMSSVFRAKFMQTLRKQINIPQSTSKTVFSKPWVVYAKQPFLGPKQVVEYLGRYTHKIAISNHRLLDIDKKKITFKYKDYRSEGQQKTMQLEAPEFIRRFALHILPHGFTRIRHYGILASKNKTVELNLAKSSLGQKPWEKQKLTWQIIAKEKLGVEENKCPKCKSLTLEIIACILPERGPPNKIKPSNDF
jgi:hypothetical protein